MIYLHSYKMESPKKLEKEISYRSLFCQVCMLIPHYYKIVL